MTQNIDTWLSIFLHNVLCSVMFEFCFVLFVLTVMDSSLLGFSSTHPDQEDKQSNKVYFMLKVVFKTDSFLLHIHGCLLVIKLQCFFPPFSQATTYVNLVPPH